MNTFIVLSSILALLTRVGFAFYAAGLVRAKNSAATVMRSITDLCIVVLAFWAFGAAILFQHHNELFWMSPDFLVGMHVDQSDIPAGWVFGRLAMILTATVLVGGAVAERCRFGALCIVSLVLAGFVLPVTGNWVWGADGWLSRRGYVDLAGGSALHLAVGVFALVAVKMVGARQGKFNRDGSSSNIPGHNLPMASIGVIVVIIGWVAYVVAASSMRFASTIEGLVAASAAMNVLLGGAAGGLVSIIVGQIRYGKPDVVLALTGVLGGLVSISAGGVVLPSWAAVIVGALGGAVIPMAVVRLDLRARLDDPLGVIAIQIVGGAWGTLAAGIFIPTPLAPKGRGEQILIQVVGMLAIAIFAAVISFLVFLILKHTVGLRRKEAEEFDGLDLAEHDVGAYPDFQQNSIKSYHLREA